MYWPQCDTVPTFRYPHASLMIPTLGLIFISIVDPFKRPKSGRVCMS